MRAGVFVLMTLAAATVATAENLCYEYPPQSYKIVYNRLRITTDPESGETKYQEIRLTPRSDGYRLLMAAEKNPGRLHVHGFFLLERQSGKVLESNIWTCPDPSPHPRRYYCYGECDSGIVSIERNGSVNFKTASIRLGESVDMPDDPGEWEISPAVEADLPAPAPVPCPPEIASMRLDLNADNTIYIENEIKNLVAPILYVCYRTKETDPRSGRSVYHGCRFTRDTCDGYYPGWKSFGTYRSEKEAMEAFRRCRGEKR